jgi:hypothetical protein
LYEINGPSSKAKKVYSWILTESGKHGKSSLMRSAVVRKYNEERPINSANDGRTAKGLPRRMYCSEVVTSIVPGQMTGINVDLDSDGVPRSM